MSILSYHSVLSVADPPLCAAGLRPTVVARARRCLRWRRLQIDRAYRAPPPKAFVVSQSSWPSLRAQAPGAMALGQDWIPDQALTDGLHLCWGRSVRRRGSCCGPPQPGHRPCPSYSACLENLTRIPGFCSCLGVARAAGRFF